MDTRATRTRLSVLPVFIALLFNIFLVSPLAPIAPNATVALAGSTFDATDGNLAVDGAETDWCSPTLAVAGTSDPERGTGDDSFKSSAENDPVPEIDVDSISNSTDYQQIYAASEVVNGQLFAYVSFIRWDTNGTGTFSFELNQSGLLTSNGVTYQRTQGDVLLEFNFQKSAENWIVTLTYRLWNGNATSGSWSDAIALAGFAEGSVNAGTIQNCLDGNASLVSGAFGEFAVNLTGLLGTDCRAFGTILAKSRASNTVTSNLDDLAGPIPVNFNTCSTITWQKDDQFGNPVSGATFRVTPNPFLAAHTGSLDVLDNFGQAGYAGADSDPIGGQFRLADVEPFTTPGYTICEWLAPSSQYVVNQTDCVTLPVGASASVDFGTFINTLLEPDVIVSKAGPTEPIMAGTAYEYVLTATNQGTFAAENVTVTDDLDDSLTIDSLTPSQGGCAAAPYVGNAISCNLGTLAANGGFATVKINVTPSAESCPEVVNQSSVSATNEPARHNGNNSSEEVTVEVLCPDPNVTKTADLSPVTAGDPAGFTITVAAGGTGDATNVELSDLNDTGVAWTIGGADAADACADLSVADGETLSCTWDVITADDPKVITITMTSVPEQCANGIANTATITADDDVDTSNNLDSDTITVLCPDLEIEKTTDTPVVNADDTVHYTVTVSNENGDAEARNVKITDDLPDGLIWTEDSEDCIIDVDGNLMCDDLVDPDGIVIAAGELFSVTLTGTTDSGDCPSIENTAEFTSSNGGDGSSDSDQRGAIVITVNCPDITVDKEPVETPISAGGQAQFTLEVTNLGLGTAYNVTVNDRAPLGTEWTVLDSDGFECSSVIGGGQQLITCTIDEMEPVAEGSATIVIGYWTTVDDCGSLLNAVRVTASNEPTAMQGNNGDSATVFVECPGLNIIKRQVDSEGVETNDPILAGETAYFEIVVWNSDDAGIGTATNVVVTENEEDLPDGVEWQLDAPEGVSCASSLSVDAGQAFTCELGDLEPGESVSILVSGVTDREDCGGLVNTARVDASNNDDEVPPATATILVSCPEIALEKVNDAVGSVLPGKTVEYTLTLTVNDDGLENGEAIDVTVYDVIPVGLQNPTNFDDGGIGGTASYDSTTRTVTWGLGDLGEGMYELTYQATLAAGVANGAVLVNAAEATSPNTPCPDRETNGLGCEDESTVIVRVPTLVIDKVASTDVITISGPANALVATPSVVTWTLTYTLTNGSVTNAVITDPVPVGFTFLDAANGGTFASGTVTWNLGTLTSSGSVSFRTTVNPVTIPRTGQTNTATIDSTETTPDTGQDGVTVVVIPPPLGGNPQPLPNTATATGLNGDPVTVPIELLVAFFIGSLGALALANVKTSNRRR